MVIGNNNTVTGMKSTVNGKNNIVKGMDSTVQGIENEVTGLGSTTNGSGASIQVAGSILPYRAHGSIKAHAQNVMLASSQPSEQDQPMGDEHGFPSSFFDNVALSFPDSKNLLPRFNPQPALSRSRIDSYDSELSPPADETFDNPFEHWSSQQPASHRREINTASSNRKERNQQFHRRLQPPATILPSFQTKHDSDSDDDDQNHRAIVRGRSKKNKIRVHLEGRDDDDVVFDHNRDSGRSVAVGSPGRGRDDEPIKSRCFICLIRKRVVMSTCCRRVSSCITCARKMYEGKTVGDVQCPNCRGVVREVYTIR